MARERIIVDQVSGWLSVFDDGSVDRTWTGPPEFKFMAEPIPAHEDFVDGVATRDVLIDSETGLRVRVYLPKISEGVADRLPIILHFHGGGFCISQGDWYMYYYFYSRLACATGAIVVSVYLCLAPEHRLPAAIDDGYTALLWLRALSRAHLNKPPLEDRAEMNESSLEAQDDPRDPWLEAHGDFGSVFLVGDSSGGNIAHHVAARAGDEDLTPLQLAGAIPIHPGFVRTERSRSEMEKPQSPMLTLDMLDKFLSFALPVGSDKSHPITCPMKTDLGRPKLPPVLLCVAEEDLIIDTEMEYYEALREEGKDVELMVSHGVGHSFYLNKVAIDLDPNTALQTHYLIAGITHFVHKHQSNVDHP